MNAEVHTFLVKNTTEHSQETLNHPDGFVLERQSRKLEMPQGSIKYMKQNKKYLYLPIPRCVLQLA